MANVSIVKKLVVTDRLYNTIFEAENSFDRDLDMVYETFIQMIETVTNNLENAEVPNEVIEQVINSIYNDFCIESELFQEF